MPKHLASNTPPECPRDPLGLAPAILAKRPKVKPSSWCPKNVDFDPMCDPDNPKTILPRDVYKAAAVVGQEIPVTPLVKSKRCAELGLSLYYKLECFNRTHSFAERGAYYALERLTDIQARDGVFTASIGNWGKAIAFKARQSRIPTTVVLPDGTSNDTLETIRAFGATAVTHGRTLAEAKKHAFVLKHEQGSGVYINGYDHPDVIAASGVIGLEILKQLPQTDAILIPVGGGGLLAGIATLVKQRKPEVLIYVRQKACSKLMTVLNRPEAYRPLSRYRDTEICIYLDTEGIEPNKCCSFFKAMENERPYRTECGFTMAESLAVPHVGFNAYHTAISLIDKMVLIDDDWIARAILHLAEVEKMVIDATGALTLCPLLTEPNMLPELQGKTVVCLITSSCIDNFKLSLAMERALETEGRIIYFTATLKAEDMATRLKLFSVISNVGVNILNIETETATFSGIDLENIHLNLMCETRDLMHACTLKRVLARIFPDICEFVEEPFSPIPICICSPKKCVM